MNPKAEEKKPQRRRSGKMHMPVALMFQIERRDLDTFEEGMRLTGLTKADLGRVMVSRFLRQTLRPMLQKRQDNPAYSPPDLLIAEETAVRNDLAKAEQIKAAAEETAKKAKADAKAVKTGPKIGHEKKDDSEGQKTPATQDLKKAAAVAAKKATGNKKAPGGGIKSENDETKPVDDTTPVTVKGSAKAA